MKKFLLLLPLANAGLNEGKISTWQACEEDSDCSVRVDRCCDAYRPGYNKAWVCGPVSINDQYRGNTGTNVANYTIPSGTLTYEFYTFQCYDAKDENKASGASKII